MIRHPFLFLNVSIYHDIYLSQFFLLFQEFFMCYYQHLKSSHGILTLPTAKAGGFLLQPLLHCLIPFGISMSYTVSTSQIILFPYALRCSSYVLLFYVYYADCICSPLFSMLILALVSLSCFVWHSGHSHLRIARFFTSGFLNPQQEHVWLLGYIVGTFTMSFPYQIDLQDNISKNLDHDAEPICCANL